MSLEKEVPKMHDPKTRLENFEFFNLWMYQIDSLTEKEKFNEQERSFLLRELKQRSRKKIFPRDNYTFSTVSHMSLFLKKNGFDDELIHPLEDHEQAHFDKATRLGYETYAEVWLLRDQHGDIAVAPSVSFTSKILDKNDNLEISLAPNDPSFTDKEHKLLSQIDYALLRVMLATKDMSPLNPLHFTPRKLHEIYLRNFMLPWSRLDFIVDEVKRKIVKDKQLRSIVSPSIIKKINSSEVQF